MLQLLRWLSYVSFFMGYGILPLSWNPVKKSVLQVVSFIYGLLLSLVPLWIDKEALYNHVLSVVGYHLTRFIVSFFILWSTQSSFFNLSQRLEELSQRFPKFTLERKRWPVIVSLVILALVGYFLTTHFFTHGDFVKSNGSATAGFIIYMARFKFIKFFLVALYILFVNEFTELFLKTEILWKHELEAVLNGRVLSKLQTYRIFHTEVSSAISIFKSAFGANMLLFFACTFGDILIAFNTYAYSNLEYNEYTFMATIEVISIMMMIKFTQDMVSASENIVSNVRSLKLSDLPSLDQLQVDLLVQKIQHRPVSVDVCGMFAINRQLIVEIIMGATTCCNAIVQLRPYIILRHVPENLTDTDNQTIFVNTTGPL